MSRLAAIHLPRWLAAAGIGAAAAVATWTAVHVGFASPEHTDEGAPLSDSVGVESDAVPQIGSAMRYARAVQEGDCEEVIQSTQWMVERLEQVRLEAGESDEVDVARDGLCKKMQVRLVERNQLQTEGIEDQYLFSPGADLEVAGTDDGRQHLARRVWERTWIRVSYPSRHCAPRDELGRPIKSLLVGVNVSADGRVLKSGVLGNLDIDRDSIVYDWESDQLGGP